MQDWVWDDGQLLARNGTLIASISGSVLRVGERELLLERGPGPRFELRTGSRVLRQQALTVSTLRADCAGRSYTLARRNPWRKRRDIIAASGVVAEIRPRLSGSVEVRRKESLPLLDAVFLSWGCVLVDSPQRETRI